MSPEELLISKKIEYLPRGADLQVKCLNPKHDDKNPSMRIDKLTGIFNCLSCGFSGNLFQHFGLKGNFLEIKRQKFKSKLLEKLSENIGLDMPTNYVPYEGDWRGLSPETYKAFNAFQHSNKEFIGRIVFPIYTTSERIAGFNGRHMTMNHDPKYLIHPPGAKLPLFPPNPKPILGRIILVEGIFDMLNLYDKGLQNAVCCFGTVKLLGKNSADAINKLNILELKGVGGIDIFFDGDDAGQTAAEGVKALCEQLEFDVRNIHYKNKDPGELTASQVLKLRKNLYE